ncbi:MAG TPA: hypothetical protein VFV80_12425, partial [Geminicoccaceae bacterium]|nr:hypothetical protein [Geminicoccaceae bacterium]
MAEPQRDLGLREPSSAIFSHRDMARGRFLERWPREFRQSRHPLRSALHRIVALRELEEQSTAINYLYSRSTFKLFNDAKILSKARVLEPPYNPLIRIEDVAAVLLLRLHRPDGTAQTRGDHAIEKRLASALSALPTTDALSKLRADQEKTAHSAAREGGAWVLDANLVDTCALAAYLVQSTRPDGVPKVNLDDFVIALLLNPAGQRWIFETFLQLAVSSPPLTIGTVLREVLADDYSRNPRFWEEILLEIDGE